MLKIKEILKAKNVSQLELAEKLEITPVGLNKIINGNPTAETLLKIAEALDVDIRELFIPTKETEAKAVYMKRNGEFVEVGNISFGKGVDL